MESDLRKRIQEGDPAVFGDPALPLVLLSGTVTADEAREGAVTYLGNGGAAQPWLLDLAQGWWEGHDDAEALLDQLARLGFKAGHGSFEHRRAALALALCARSVCHLTGEQRDQAEACLGELERWAWGDDSALVESARQRAERLHESAVGRGAPFVDAFCAVHFALCAAAYVDDLPMNVARLVGAACLAGLDLGENALDEDGPALVAITIVRDEHARALAGLIRAAVPVFPLPRAGAAEELRRRIWAGDLAALLDPALPPLLLADGPSAEWWRVGALECAAKVLAALASCMPQPRPASEPPRSLRPMLDHALRLRARIASVPVEIDDALGALRRCVS